MAAHLKYKSGSSWIDYNLVIYPVGAVYISYTSTSPASLFGGSWTAITGRFPYFNAGTRTGGSNTHTLQTSEIPSHTHGLGMMSYNVGPGGSATVPAAIGGTTPWHVTQSTGGGAAHNNMPAYQTFYAWRRTA